MSRLAVVVGSAPKAMLFLATICLLTMVVLLIIASAMRYLAHAPFASTEELVSLLYMGMVFLALPAATVHKIHVSISVLPARVNAFLRRPFTALAALIMIIFCLWFTVTASTFVSQSYQFQSRSDVGILLWPWMVVIPVSIALSAIVTFMDLVTGWKEVDANSEELSGDGL